jgi:hypothetical protein
MQNAIVVSMEGRSLAARVARMKRAGTMLSVLKPTRDKKLKLGGLVTTSERDSDR